VSFRWTISWSVRTLFPGPSEQVKPISELTNQARATQGEPCSAPHGKGSLEEIVAANPARRTLIKGGLGLSLTYAFGASSLLGACGGGSGATSAPAPPPLPTASPAPGAAPLSYEIAFGFVARTEADIVTVPQGYVAEVIFSAGDPVLPGAGGWTGSFLSSAETEKIAGGNHDGMHYFAIPNADPQQRGLLAINHEYPDFNILMSGAYDAASASAEQKRIALSAVGVSVIEVQRDPSGTWSVNRSSTFNRRYTGNSIYRVAGPAADAIGESIIGTLNNCSSGGTPWGTFLTCEETTQNYLDPTQPANGYGWVVEIDPLAEAPDPIKRTALGRFKHENVAFLADSDNRVALYMGNDNTPGCIYKFVPSRPFSPSSRAANSDLLDFGTLYVARFDANGTGEWRDLTLGRNGLVAGATDPGNVSQGNATPTVVNFATQADVLIDAEVAARVAGGTVMDRPEWISVAPDKSILCTLTNNSDRQVVDAANPRTGNLHGHIIKMRETGDAPFATRFAWEILLLAGDPSLANGGANLVGNIVGDSFSSPDGIRVDPQNRLWVQTDHTTPGNSGVAGRTMDQVFGNNSMFYVDPASKRSRRFLVGPLGCEITGIAYPPDLTTFFINIQHPTGAWPEPGKQSRSSTIVVRRTDGKAVGT
jgi:secreted PhoX family phosphatase